MTGPDDVRPKDVREVVDAYVDSYRRNDREGCIALFAPDAVWHDPVGEPPHVGHVGIGAFWDQARVLAESIELVPSDVIVCANQAAMVFEIHVTLKTPEGSPPATMIPTTMIMDAVEIFVLDDHGHISELRAYWDMSRARTRGSARFEPSTPARRTGPERDFDDSTFPRTRFSATL